MLAEKRKKCTTKGCALLTALDRDGQKAFFRQPRCAFARRQPRIYCIDTCKLLAAASAAARSVTKTKNTFPRNWRQHLGKTRTKAYRVWRGVFFLFSRRLWRGFRSVSREMVAVR